MLSIPTAEVWEWLSIFMPHLTEWMIAYPALNELKNSYYQQTEELAQ